MPYVHAVVMRNRTISQGVRGDACKATYVITDTVTQNQSATLKQ